MTERIDTMLKSLSDATIPGPSKQAVLQRGRRRRTRSRVVTGLAVVVLLAGGTTTMAALQMTGSVHPRPGAPGVIGPDGSRAGYPASFVAVHGLAVEARIAQVDSTTGTVRTYLTGRDTGSPAIAGGRLYYLEGASDDCAEVWQQPLAGGTARQVAIGRFTGADRLVSDGQRRLAWLGCTLHDRNGPYWEGRVLHVQDIDGGQAMDVKVDVDTLGIDGLSIARDGRLVVFGQTSSLDVAYVVDPAKTDRLSAGHRLTPPTGCHFAAAAWHGTDLTAAVSCPTGSQAAGTGQDNSRLVTVSGATLQVTQTIAHVGPGPVFAMTVARNGATLVVLGSNGMGTGPVPRVVNGSVTLLPGIKQCPLVDQPCGDTFFDTPVWLE